MTQATTKNTHESIIEKANSPATVNQCNYLMSLYRDALLKSVTDKHDNLNIENDYLNFRKRFGGLSGTWTLHLFDTFIPQNGKKYMKNEVSKLISDAISGKFNKTFINSFLKSKNSYVKPSSES